MSQFKRLIVEIHRRSLWQVLGIYVVGSWIAYQVVLDLAEGLGLPEWLPSLAVALFIIGLPVVLATAFVQESSSVGPSQPGGDLSDHPRSTRTAEDSDYPRPTHRLLTWRNAILGGVGAFAVWGMLAAGWLLLGAGSPASPRADASNPSIAVLPFTSIGEDPENGIFADGIHEDLLTQLSKISNLMVISRTSVMQFRDTEMPIREIAEGLGVTAVLEGSVRRAGDRIRINAQLIDARTDGHLWAETYDRDLTDIFAVQSEIATRIAEELRVALTPTERERLASNAAETELPAAYRHYVRGRFFWNQRRPEALTQAIQEFSTALELDPSYARAHAGLADAYLLSAWYAAEPPRQAFANARRAAENALDLNPDLAEAHTSVGLIYRAADLDWEASERSYRRAIELNPGYATAHQWLGQLLALTGRRGEAMIALERARDLDPLSAAVISALGDAAFYFGEVARADSIFRTAEDLSIGITNDIDLRLMLALGDTASARAALQRPTPSSARGLANLGYVAGVLGERGIASRQLELLRQRERRQGIPSALSALVHLGLGDTDAAIASIDAAVEARDPWVTFVLPDPVFGALVTDPRWSELRERLRLP